MNDYYLKRQQMNQRHAGLTRHQSTHALTSSRCAPQHLGFAIGEQEYSTRRRLILIVSLQEAQTPICRLLQRTPLRVTMGYLRRYCSASSVLTAFSSVDRSTGAEIVWRRRIRPDLSQKSSKAVTRRPHLSELFVVTYPSRFPSRSQLPPPRALVHR